jgi:HEAT repeat protein
MEIYNPEEKANDPRSTEELLKIAVSDFGSDDAWSAIGVMHSRGSGKEFEAAKKLCFSSNSSERQVGAHILGQLGWGKKTFLEESVSILITLLKDSEEGVIVSAASALGHRGSEKSIPHLLKLKNHSNPDIRLGVVHGLTAQEDKDAVDALIELSTDSEQDVRNWATFALGSILEADTAQIRNALFDRIADENPEIRGEAFIGLAARKDERVIKPLINELKGDFYGSWCLEAAELLGLPIFHPLLLELKKRWGNEESENFHQDMEDALAACKPA